MAEMSVTPEGTLTMSASWLTDAAVARHTHTHKNKRESKNTSQSKRKPVSQPPINEDACVPSRPRATAAAAAPTAEEHLGQGARAALAIVSRFIHLLVHPVERKLAPQPINSTQN